MEAYEVSSFARLDNSQLGQGQTTEYRNRHGETLAYVDYNHDRTLAAVSVFTPYNDGERRYSERPVRNAEAIAAKHIAKLGYVAPFEDKRDAVVEEDDVIVVEHDHDDEIVEEDTRPYTEEGLQRLLDDINSIEPSPLLCPRCGINELDIDRPALNARSRHLPLAICSACGTHESLSSVGLDLWHDQYRVTAALDEQRASRAAADVALQQSIAGARQARAERLARETLCELTPAQSSAVAAAVVWP
jgi:hypothetical protein